MVDEPPFRESGPTALHTHFADHLAELAVEWRADPVVDPTVLALNESLAVDLGLDPGLLAGPAGVRQLLGHDLPSRARPVAQAYAGHQFGGLSPRLGDGRALLLGEMLRPDGTLVDLHLKGSGRTPFSRGGDGKAAVGPMLREYLIGEAMAALGIPTTRALAVIGTGETVRREAVLPGAVLVRTASSHLRVGTFQYAALSGDHALLQRLTEYAIARHHPGAASAENPALGLLSAVIDVQADLVARWMGVGFVHGVMNTDNTTISGETIDYGPCAFMDHHDAATVFSSIDHAGRYAYANQPSVLHWNLARLAEALLALIDPDADRAVELATATLEEFPAAAQRAWLAEMRAKLGLGPTVPTDEVAALTSALLALLSSRRFDHTSWFRELADRLRDDQAAMEGEADVEVAAWIERWRSHVEGDPHTVAAAMDRVNPRYIARNHLVQAALDAASDDGDLSRFRELLDVLADPWTVRPGLDRYEGPAPEAFGRYVTYCGT